MAARVPDDESTKIVETVIEKQSGKVLTFLPKTARTESLSPTDTASSTTANPPSRVMTNIMSVPRSLPIILSDSNDDSYSSSVNYGWSKNDSAEQSPDRSTPDTSAPPTSYPAALPTAPLATGPAATYAAPPTTYPAAQPTAPLATCPAPPFAAPVTTSSAAVIAPPLVRSDSGQYTMSQRAMNKVKEYLESDRVELNRYAWSHFNSLSCRSCVGSTRPLSFEQHVTEVLHCVGTEVFYAANDFEDDIRCQRA